MNLDTNNWEVFYLKDLYEIKLGNKFDKNKMTTDNPDINFVTRIGYDNGVDEKVDRIDGTSPFPKGILTVSLGGSIGECYLQVKPFYTAQNVAVLVPKSKEMNSFVNLFISTLIKYESKFKYYPFGRELNSHIKKDFTIYLPIQRDSNNQITIDKDLTFSQNGYVPNWEFMDKFMRSLNRETLSTHNSLVSLPRIEISSWKSFVVADIFSILNGVGITLDEILENPGEFNAVQSGEANNGVIGKISLDYCIRKKYVYTNEACLTVARTGSAGYVSFQRNGCVVGDSAKILLLKYSEATPSIYLFLQAILSANKFKYTFGRKVTEENYSKITIKLPIQKNNDGAPYIDNKLTYSQKGYVPDWEYMKKYIKSMPFGDKIT